MQDPRFTLAEDSGFSLSVSHSKKPQNAHAEPELVFAFSKVALDTENIEGLYIRCGHGLTPVYIAVVNFNFSSFLSFENVQSLHVQ